MKLIKIEGKPYEITIFQESPFEPVEEDDYKEINKNLIEIVTCKRKNFNSGCTRIYSDYKIRTKGYAWIEIKPLINEKYCIYLDKKGFYCNVLKHKIYLKDIFNGSIEN